MSAIILFVSFLVMVGLGLLAWLGMFFVTPEES